MEDQVKLIEIPPEEPKGPAAPAKKKALSAYNIFLKRYKENGASKATLPELSQKWGQMSEAEREPYKKEAEEEKAKAKSEPHEPAAEAPEKQRTFALNRIKQKVKLVATEKKIRKDALTTIRTALVRHGLKLRLIGAFLSRVRRIGGQGIDRTEAKDFAAPRHYFRVTIE